jgi:hypothetical protein
MMMAFEIAGIIIVYTLFQPNIVLNTTIITNRSLKRGKRLAYSGIDVLTLQRRTLQFFSTLTTSWFDNSKILFRIFSCLISPRFDNLKITYANRPLPSHPFRPAQLCVRHGKPAGRPSPLRAGRHRGILRPYCSIGGGAQR